MATESNPTPKAPKILKSFKDMARSVTREVEVPFRIDGDIYKVKMRSLTRAEMAEADMHTDVMPPPMLAKNERTGKVEPTGDFDFNDPGYKREFGEGQLLRQSAMIDKALIDFKIDGTTLEEKAKALNEQLTSQVVEALVRQIEMISSDRIPVGEAAVFVSADD